MTSKTTQRIAFQGELGAYSHQACHDARPDMDVVPCATFEDVIEAVRSGEADQAMLPVENSTEGVDSQRFPGVLLPLGYPLRMILQDLALSHRYYDYAAGGSDGEELHHNAGIIRDSVGRNREIKVSTGIKLSGVPNGVPRLVQNRKGWTRQTGVVLREG